MRRLVIAVPLLAVFLITVVAQKAATPEAQLGAIINLAEGEGKYDEAIPRYKKFIADNGGNATLKAKALFNLALAYEHIDSAEAQKTYDQLITGYPQSSFAGQAQQRVAVLENSKQDTPARELTVRLISTQPPAGRGNRFAEVANPGLSIIPTNSTLSADGKFAAYVNGRGLVVRNMSNGQVIRPVNAQDGSRQTKAMVNGVEQSLPAASMGFCLISPDGTQVVYGVTTLEWPGPAVRVSSFDLKVIPNDVNGKPRRVVTSGGELGTLGTLGSMVPQVWAPDGRSIIVLIFRADTTWQIGRVWLANGKVDILKSLGWRVRSTSVAISPDGKYIAYNALAGNPPRDGDDPEDPEYIYVLALDGSLPETPIVKGADFNGHPIWMPDGKHILFDSNRSGNFGLYAIRMEQGKAIGNPYSVKGDIRIQNIIGMTRSGSLYYSTFQSNTQSLRVAQLDGKVDANREEVLLGQAPAWSPDGQTIAFVKSTTSRGRGSPGTGMPEVFSLGMYSISSEAEKRYGFPSREKWPLGAGWPNPIWLHDGRAVLLFTQDADGVNSLYRADVRTGEFKRIAAAPNELFRGDVALSPNDQHVYVIDSQTSERARSGVKNGERVESPIVEINLATGQPRTVSTVSTVQGGSTQLAVSADNRTLYLNTTFGGTSFGNNGTRTSQYLSIDVATGRQTTLSGTPSSDNPLSDDVFSSDRSTAYTIECESRCRIAAADLKTGKKKEIYDAPPDAQLQRLFLSPDSRSLVFATRTDIGWKVMRVGVDGSAVRTLDVPQSTGSPTPRILRSTPDGKAVFIFHDAAVSRVPIDGSQADVIVSRLNTNAVSPDYISPDGSRLVVPFNEIIPESVWALDNISSVLKPSR